MPNYDRMKPLHVALLGAAMLIIGPFLSRLHSEFLPYLGDVLFLAGIYTLYKAWQKYKDGKGGEDR